MLFRSAGARAVRLLGVSVHNFVGDHDVADAPDRLPFERDENIN